MAGQPGSAVLLPLRATELRVSRPAQHSSQKPEASTMRIYCRGSAVGLGDACGGRWDKRTGAGQGLLGVESPGKPGGSQKMS